MQQPPLILFFRHRFIRLKVFPFMRVRALRRGSRGF